MALSYPVLRQAWAPACADGGKDLLPFYVALDYCFKCWRYQPKAGTGAYNCRRVTGGSGWSMHAFKDAVPFNFWNGFHLPNIALAVDVNPSQNPYGPRLVTDMPRAMVDAIERVRTRNGKQLIQWGGYYSGNKDAMHYEGVCTPADLRTGVDPRTLPAQTAPAPKPPAPKPPAVNRGRRLIVISY